jgi:hypothetical protein
MANSEDQTTEKTRPAVPEGATRVHWTTSNLKSTYCNVCNATSTREEVVLNFGVNSNWDRPQPELEIELAHRIILSPFAAKRLTEVLNNLMKEYEARYGALS